ncbi:MAG: hypothetical protein NZ805_01795 [Armatimonadetes bacterium]|nr:hypothetical protein [Armatimonadota bacterium]MDW8027137.1 hypothetical protein [Armatimonadota bacterium]
MVWREKGDKGDIIAVRKTEFSKMQRQLFVVGERKANRRFEIQTTQVKGYGLTEFLLPNRKR